MTSLGNDIVVLDDTAHRSSHPSFYPKIITAAEEALYAHRQLPHLPFDHFVWMCWALKESVVKCIRREYPHLSGWPPKALITSLAPTPASRPTADIWLDLGDPPPILHTYTATASLGGIPAQCQAFYTNRFIAAIAIPDPPAPSPGFPDIHVGIRRIPDASPEHQSAAVRAFALQRLCRLFPGQVFPITKHPVGYPLLGPAGGPPAISLSLSHHLDLVSYAFMHTPGYTGSCTATAKAPSPS